MSNKEPYVRKLEEIYSVVKERVKKAIRMGEDPHDIARIIDWGERDPFKEYSE